MMQLYKDPSDIVILTCQADDFRDAGIKAIFTYLDQASLEGSIKGFGLKIDGSYIIYQHFVCITSEAATAKAQIDRIIERNYPVLIQRILSLRHNRDRGTS